MTNATDKKIVIQISLLALLASSAVYLGWKWEQDRQSISVEIPFKTSVSALQQYRLQRLWLRQVPNWVPVRPAYRPRLIVVGQDGETFKMPDEFNLLVRRARLSVSSQADALDIAATYVTLTAPFGKLVVVSGLEMIPGLSRNPPLTPLQTAVSAPVVVQQIQHYAVQLFTWRELGGILEEWTIKVSENGTIETKKSEIATKIGETIGLP